MTGSSAMTRRIRSRRVDRVSSPIGPASVADNPAVTSAERAANWAASRLRARPKSVPATTIPAHTIPMQISLTRVTANVKASPFTPPVAPSRSLAMTTAVKPASAAPYEATLREACRQDHDRHRSNHGADHAERGFAQRSAETGLTDDRRGSTGPVRIVEFEPKRDIECEGYGCPNAQSEQQRWADGAQRAHNPPSGRSAGPSRIHGPKSSVAHGPWSPSRLVDIATASRASPAGKARDRRPIAASHIAPAPQPIAKPTIAGQVRIARSRALATSAGLRASITSPTSIMKRVMLVVMTAVDGAPFSDTCTSAFCTAIAETPSMPARIAIDASGSIRRPAETHRTRKPTSSRSCSRRRGRSEANPTLSKVPASSLVNPNAATNTGTDSIGATGAPLPLTRCAARMTRLPVTWAVNRPPSPRKPMASTLPAIMLSTVGSNLAPSELAIDGVGTRGVRYSAISDIYPTLIREPTR